MMELTRKYLKRSSVHLSNSFFTTHDKPRVLLDNMRDQLLRYRETRKVVSDDPYDQGKRAWSGKVGGLPDDLAVALQLVIYWRERFWEDGEKYEVYHQH